MWDHAEIRRKAGGFAEFFRHFRASRAIFFIDFSNFFVWRRPSPNDRTWRKNEKNLTKKIDFCCLFVVKIRPKIILILAKLVTELYSNTAKNPS